MKKGFTLIELLAVIIILALLMIVAVPNVLSTLNSAKKSTFVTQSQSIYKTAQQQWTKDSMIGSAKQVYSDSGDKLDLSKVSSDVKYCVKINGTGTIEKLVVDDGTFHIETTTTIDSLTSEVVTDSTGTVDCGTVENSQTYTLFYDQLYIREDKNYALLFKEDGEFQYWDNTSGPSQILKYEVDVYEDGTVEIYVYNPEDYEDMFDIYGLSEDGRSIYAAGPKTYSIDNEFRPY